jgi:hypothetical protein
MCISKTNSNPKKDEAGSVGRKSERNHNSKGCTIFYPKAPDSKSNVAL